LGQLDQAAKQGAKIAGISSGGELLSRARDRGIPHLRVPSNLPPRVALPELTAAVMFTLGSAGILKNAQGLLSDAALQIRDLIHQLKAEVPSTKNPAKKCAVALHRKLPLIVGDEEYRSVLRRFKNQINENAKMPAFYYTMPEGFHNDIEGLETLSKLANVQPILLQTVEASEGQSRTVEQLIRSFEDMGYPRALKFQGSGPDKFSELLTAATFADFVSVYLAALRGVDPAELTMIPKFKAVMQD
jgi:glucose/mannose-6-phosphate isomerase